MQRPARASGEGCLTERSLQFVPSQPSTSHLNHVVPANPLLYKQKDFGCSEVAGYGESRTRISPSAAQLTHRRISICLHWAKMGVFTIRPHTLEMIEIFSNFKTLFRIGTMLCQGVVTTAGWIYSDTARALENTLPRSCLMKY
jgi:hypothetical protein